MEFFIQKNIFRDSNYYKLEQTVQTLGYNYQCIEFVNNSTDLIFTPTDTNNIFCFGSIKLANCANKYGWFPGSLYNENHDYRVYSQYYKENLLNWDSQVINFADDFIEPGYVFHARPCIDNKIFSGQIFTRESWNEFVNNSLKVDERFKNDTPVQISKNKEINREIRFFIVGGEIITASQYKLGNRVIYQENTESYLHDMVKDMISIYQPATSFVMDIAQTPNGLKIIEINCINCSGFYDIDLQKLIFSINEYYNF